MQVVLTTARNDEQAEFPPDFHGSDPPTAGQQRSLCTEERQHPSAECLTRHHQFATSNQVTDALVDVISSGWGCSWERVFAWAPSITLDHVLTEKGRESAQW